jgi:hypothetical protein
VRDSKVAAVTDTCEKCGAVLHIGSYPFCKGNPSDHGRGAAHVRPDEVPGGFWVENAWREPRKFYSQSEYEKALAADGLQLNPHWVPGSKHLTRWATVDPVTLENGRILVARQAASQSTGTEFPVTCETLTINTRVLDAKVTIQADRT